MKQLIILMVALAVASSFAAFKFGKQRQAAADEARLHELGQLTKNGQATIIKTYRTHDSIEHVVIREVPVSTSGQKSEAVGSAYLRDTVAKALDLAVKQLDEVTRVNARLMAENIQLTQGAHASTVYYKDKWLSLEYDKDSNRANLAYDAGINVVKYWKRPWLFGAKREYIDIYGDDPRLKVNAVKRFTVAAAKPKRLGIGVTGGYGYVPARNQMEAFVGLGVSYHVVEF